MLPQSVRHDQDIGKQDRSVEAKPVDRLQGYFASRFAVVGHGEKAALFRPQRAIFGQVTTSLAHEPERHLRTALAVKRIEKKTGHR